MNKFADRASLVAATCACLSVGTAHTETPAGADPWTKAPALPTACYDGNDGFADQVEAARTALAADAERQKAVNAQIEEQFNSIDPMEKAERMQQWMMSNPQEAALVLGGQQQMGMQQQAENPQLNADSMRFDAERRTLGDKYLAAAKQAQAPANAGLEALNARLTAAGCGFDDTECSIPESAYAERDVLLRQRDAAYQANCATYWAATGPMQDYAKRYRKWMSEKWIPNWQQTDEVMRSQFAIMDTPGQAWSSTIPQEHVSRYLNEIGQLYALRDGAPTCAAEGCPRH